MSAMTLSHAPPDTAMPENTALLQLLSALSQSSTDHAAHTRARRAQPCTSRRFRTVASSLLERPHSDARCRTLPPRTMLPNHIRALLLGSLLFLFVNGAVPLRAFCFLESTDSDASTSAAPTRPWPSPHPCPAAAVTAEAAPAPPFALRMLRTSPCHLLPPPTYACIPPPQFPCNSDMHSTFPRHVPFPPWDPPDPQPCHVPCGHVPLPHSPFATCVTAPKPQLGEVPGLPP